MPSLISDITFVVGRGQQYDPAAGTYSYRNPALKNRNYRPFQTGYGYISDSKFTKINDTVNDIYGFDITIPSFQFQNGEEWFISLFSNEAVTDITGQSTIIDNTYFIRNIHIADAITKNEVKNEVLRFIAKYEPEILQKLLGYQQYKEFFDSVTGPTPAQKYQDLLFGKEYTDKKGHLQKWMGFTNPNKLSIIANYVYYWYSRQIETYSSGQGEQVMQAENGRRTSANYKAIWAWNEMVKWVSQLYLYLSSHPGDYPLWKQYCFPVNEFQTINEFGI